jgi:4-hydroxy-2-oxoheptanedioate aldolase
VEFAQERNRDLLLIGLLESKKGLDNIEEICAVENGLDVVFLGRSDLASELGRPGQVGDAIVEEASLRILKAASERGVRTGLAHYTGAECETWARRGCSFFAFASESGLMYEYFSSLRRDVDQRWAQLEDKP